VILTVKFAVVHHAAGSGLIGILNISVASGAIDPDFEHVTVDQTVALHDQPLSENAEVGHEKFAGTVKEPVVVPVDEAFPALVITIGS
jgi:hypothetical protein